MSNRQLEEQQERQRDEAVAAALGISVETLLERGYSVDENVGNDGTVYSHIVTFDDGQTDHIQLPD